MSLRQPNWYNLNSTRSYPLDDRATRTGDDGARLPDNLILDVSLRFPRDLGQYAHLSAVTVTPTMVTAVFLASQEPDSLSDFQPLAAITVVKPLQANRHYALSPLAAGVAGWIVFGELDEAFSARFSTPLQGLLLPRCARSYFGFPTESLVKSGVGVPLRGIIRLHGGSDVEVVGGDRIIDGYKRTVAIARLKSFSSGRNVFDIYKGPCGARPESDNCDRPGVQFLNTVGPDCAGNIQISFVGDADTAAYSGSSGGFLVDYDIGLTEACITKDRLPDKDGRLPNEYDDLCSSEYGGSDGEAGGPVKAFSVATEIVESPGYITWFSEPDPDWSLSGTLTPGSRGLESTGSDLGTAIWIGDESEALERFDARADFRGEVRAGIILGHTARGHLRAILDASAGKLKIVRWDGSRLVSLGEVEDVRIGKEATLTVSVRPSESHVNLSAFLTDGDEKKASLTITVGHSLTVGRVGVVVDRSVVSVTGFFVEEVRA